MLSINGLNRFREFFQKYNTNYVLIGGTACAIIFDEIGQDFRATKDLDVVLIVENLNKEFGIQFWNFIKEADYTIESNPDKKNFYRFTKPTKTDYPKMIELFSKNEVIDMPSDIHLIPIHISDDVSSLSAILLNDDYYNFMINGIKNIDDIAVLDEKHLIPFKVKAWCELIERRNNGEQGQSKHIKKHCRDINNLMSLLIPNDKVTIEGMVREDMETFINSIEVSEYIPSDINKTSLKETLSKIYL